MEEITNYAMGNYSITQSTSPAQHRARRKANARIVPNDLINITQTGV